MSQTECPQCSKPMRLPEGSAGKRIKCSECGEVSRIHELEDGSLSLTPPSDDSAPADAAPGDAAEIRCAECDAPLRGDAQFCVACGAAIEGATSEELTKAAGRPRARPRGTGRRAKQANTKNIKKAAAAILIVSILFVIGGTFFGFKAYGESQDAIEQLNSRFDPSDMIELEDGEVISAAELEDMIRGEVAMVFVIMYGLAGIMLGLFFWARKSPLPATISALSVYVVVLAIDAVFDPTTIYRGIIMKAIIIAMMFGGISAALKERAAEPRGAGRVAVKRAARRAPARRSAAE